MRMKRMISAALCLALVLAMLPGMSALAGVLYQRGDSGEAVLALQTRLAALDYTDTETDGVFGPGTEKAVLCFQEANDLLETGMVDSVTYRVLMSDAAIKAPSLSGWSWYEDDGAMMVEASEEVMSCAMPMATSMPAMGNTATAAESVSWDTREYATFAENGFKSVAAAPLSTFGADVDTASWSQVRQMILRGQTISPDSVRVEEMLNYFSYSYKAPEAGEPFGVTMELGDCPWNPETKLLLIGLQAEKVQTEAVPKNLVFLIDVSGSMDDETKLPLVKRSFLLLLDTLGPNDTVSIVTYASSDRVVLDGVPASEKTTIMAAINDLTAGGGTNGAAGIQTAYQLAEQHYVQGGINRILLATDGDLNIGIHSEGDLARLVLEKKEGGVSLTCLGFGSSYSWYSNYKDNRMEALADYGDGNYFYIDSIHEARRALVTGAGGTFHTVAKDVKLQVDFNPAFIKGYRLIGYEDRLLAAEDFADDTVDGGEIGSGHRVTALYELVPVDSAFDFGGVLSKYSIAGTVESGEWLTLSIRAKAPEGSESVLYTYPLADPASAEPTENLTFAAGVAEVAMLLRNSRWSGTATWDSALTLLRSCPSVTGDSSKEELVYLVGLLQQNAQLQK